MIFQLTGSSERNHSKVEVIRIVDEGFASMSQDLGSGEGLLLQEQLTGSFTKIIFIYNKIGNVMYRI